MSTADVRKIEALEQFRQQLVVYAETLSRDAEDANSVARRLERIVTDDLPAYWSAQLQQAEARLNEARDHLQRARSAVRAADRPAATEAAAKVARCERRVRFCEDKFRRAKDWKPRIQTAINDWMGPRGDLTTHAESVLPQAAEQLKRIVDQLRTYQEP